MDWRWEEVAKLATTLGEAVTAAMVTAAERKEAEDRIKRTEERVVAEAYDRGDIDGKNSDVRKAQEAALKNGHKEILDACSALLIAREDEAQAAGEKARARAMVDLVAAMMSSGNDPLVAKALDDSQKHCERLERWLRYGLHAGWQCYLETAEGQLNGAWEKWTGKHETAYKFLLAGEVRPSVPAEEDGTADGVAGRGSDEEEAQAEEECCPDCGRPKTACDSGEGCLPF